jgi:hypothetical protein
MKRLTTIVLLALAASAPAARPAYAQEAGPAAPEVKPANGRSIELEGQLQFQAASTTVDSVVTWDSELRRMRLTAIGQASDEFSGTLQTDFGAERARVRDAFVEWKPSSAFALRAGQFKIPFNGIEMTSSKRLLVIERANRIRGLPAQTTSGFLEENHLSARNRGFMATLRPGAGRFAIIAGGWQGNGEAADNNDGKEVAARLEYSALPLPEKTSKPLILAAAAVANGYFGGPRDTLRVAGGDSLRVEDPQYAVAFEGWVEYGKYLLPGLHVAGNAIFGDDPEELRLDSGDLDFRRFVGLQAWGEYLVSLAGPVVTALAPAFRADRFDPDTDVSDDANVLLTPGLNVYFGSNVKAQLNVDVLVPEDDALETESAVRVQTQLLF